MSVKLEPLEPDHIYHIYNHAVSEDNLFRQQSDYFFFMEKFSKYVLPFFDVYAYTLMPNHFHFAVQAKSVKNIHETLEEYRKQKHGLYKTMKDKENAEGLVLSKCLSNFFNTYSKNYDKIYNRKGTLFMRPFNRKPVTSDTHLQDLIKYIHLNPVEARFCIHPSQWKFSSFNAIVDTKETFVQKEKVIELFFNLENFIFCNTKQISKIENAPINKSSNLPFNLPF